MRDVTQLPSLFLHSQNCISSEERCASQMGQALYERELEPEERQIGKLEYRLRGLCSTCNKRDVCNRSHYPGGVWHCIDYIDYE